MSLSNLLRRWRALIHKARRAAKVDPSSRYATSRAAKRHKVKPQKTQKEQIAPKSLGHLCSIHENRFTTVVYWM